MDIRMSAGMQGSGSFTRLFWARRAHIGRRLWHHLRLVSVFTGLLLFPLMALAVGLGTLQVKSRLNDPLQVVIPILDAKGLVPSDIQARLASGDIFARFQVDRSFYLTRLQFSVETDEANRPIVRITTDRPFAEPYLRFIMDFRWPEGRLFRTYTLLLNPPRYSGVRHTSHHSQVLEQARHHPVAQNETPPVQQTQAFPVEEQAAPSSYGPIKPEDRLWQIIKAVRPDPKLTIDQTALAIFKANPKTFGRHNINDLLVGSVLHIPSAAEIGAVSAHDAEREIAAHNARWAAHQQQHAGGGESAPHTAKHNEVPPQQKTSAEQAEAPKLIPLQLGVSQLEQNATVAQPTAATQSAPTPNQAKDLQAELALTAGELHKEHEANKALEAEIAKVEKENETLKASVVSKDKMLLTLEEELAPQHATAEPASDKDVNDDQFASSAESDVVSPLAGNKAIVGVTPESSQTAVSWWQYVILAVLLMLIVAGGYFLWWRQQHLNRKYAADEALDEENTKTLAASSDADTVAPRAPAEATETPLSSAQQEAPLSVDTLEEAVVYMAYGRYQQARKLLEAAIAGGRAQLSYRMALLECLAALNETTLAQMLAQQLNAETITDVSIQQKLAELTQQLATPPLSSSPLAGAPPTVTPIERPAESPPISKSKLSSTTPIEERTSKPSTISSADTKAMVERLPDVHKPENADADDMETSASVSDAVEEEAVATAPVSPKKVAATSEAEAEQTAAASAVTVDTIDDSDIEQAADADTPFDMDFETGLGQGFTVDKHKLDEGVLAAADVDNEVPLVDADNVPDLHKVSTAQATPDNIPGPLQPAESTPSVDIRSLLDLAAAYIEIEDIEGARDLLKDVLIAGDEAQQAKANAMLERIKDKYTDRN